MRENEEKPQTIFEDGQVIGTIQVSALTVPKMELLIKRHNRIFGDEPRPMSDTQAASEVLYVLANTGAKLAKMARASEEEWDAAVESFALTHEESFDDFMRALLSELEAQAASAVEPVIQGKQQAGRSEKVGPIPDGGQPSKSPASVPA